jgi:hypothetical protein
VNINHICLAKSLIYDSNEHKPYVPG